MMSDNTKAIISLYDGQRTSKEVSKILGLSPRYVRRIAQKYDLDRLGVGAQRGENNHQFVSGRRIDLDGYVLVTSPPNHPFARKRKDRTAGVIFEHRLILERVLGRYLLPEETADHIDGLTLHNDPSNLRLFQGNGDHLRATITGRVKQTSVSGKKNIRTRYHRDASWKQVDTHYRRRERGDVRLRQMILAALKLGIDSPFLLGTRRHFEKAGIDPTSRASLELALEQLNTRWAADLDL